MTSDSVQGWMLYGDETKVREVLEFESETCLKYETLSYDEEDTKSTTDILDGEHIDKIWSLEILVTKISSGESQPGGKILPNER